MQQFFFLMDGYYFSIFLLPYSLILASSIAAQTSMKCRIRGKTLHSAASLLAKSLNSIFSFSTFKAQLFPSLPLENFPRFKLCKISRTFLLFNWFIAPPTSNFFLCYLISFIFFDYIHNFYLNTFRKWLFYGDYFYFFALNQRRSENIDGYSDTKNLSSFRSQQAFFFWALREKFIFQLVPHSHTR